MPPQPAYPDGGRHPPRGGSVCAARRDARRERSASGRDGVHPVSQGRRRHPRRLALVRLPAPPRLPRAARRLPRHRCFRGHHQRRVHAARAARRPRRHRVVRCAALVRRPRQHDRHLLWRLHLAPGREPRAAPPDEHRADRLHRRSLYRRLPLPRRPRPDAARPWLLRRIHGRVQRTAAGAGALAVQLGGDLGGAPRRRRALCARVAAPPDRRRRTGATAPSATSPTRSAARSS